VKFISGYWSEAAKILISKDFDWEVPEIISLNFFKEKRIPQAWAGGNTSQ
jgi:hypothetical protein